MAQRVKQNILSEKGCNVMKKFRVAPQTAKRIKAIVAAALALALAVPTTSYLSSKVESSSVDAEGSTDVPTPIMSVDFESGFAGEASKNGLEVVKSAEVLKFKEDKDDKGNYKYDTEGHIVYAMTDTPFIEAGEYKRGVVGNQPTTAYDSKMGNVLSLDGTVEIPEFKKKVSDELDSKYPVGKVLQEAVTAESQISLKNPFAGLDLSEEYNEETGWTKGVSISYWVKAAEEKDADGNVAGGVNSSIINFNNDGLVTMQKDDYMKYTACHEYSESDPRYSMGDTSIMTDADGNTYEVYQNYGVLIRFNPNYPKNSEGASVKGGWYIPTEASKAKITVTDADGNEYKIASLAGETAVDEGLYSKYNYRYAKEDNLEAGYSSKSLIREEAIKGSMSISTSDDFAFRNDDYRTEQQTDGSVKPVEGTKITNPNTTQYKNGEEFSQFDVYNQFFFNGDATATTLGEEETTVDWHFVTVVIQNDMVYFYVDGEKIDPEESYRYCGGTDNEADFQKMNAGKAFNQGRGIGYMDGIFGYDESNISDWSADGTANESPANSCSITMLDWLSDANTKLYIGGNGYAADCNGIDMAYGTADGTMLDDLNFYDVPLTDEQAKALYDNSKASKEAEPALAQVESFTFDDGTMNGSNGTTLGTVDTNLEGADPAVVSDASRGNVLAIQNNKASGTSAVKLSKNPFTGLDLTGATVNFWVKEPAQGKGSKQTVAQSVALSFMDTKKVKNYDKMGATVKGTESASLLYLTTACDGFFYEGSTNATYQSLGNNFLFSTKRNGNIDSSKNEFEQESLDKYNEYIERLQTMSSWHMVSMVMENSGLKIYYDGEELPNNMYDKGTNAPNFFGLRFYDGYYGRIYDGYKADKNNCGSNNQFALPLLTFLSDPTTSAYVGYANKLGSDATFERTYTSYFDDIAYYSTALSSDQIKKLYDEQVKTEVPDQTTEPTKVPTDDNGGNKTPGGAADEQKVAGQTDGDMVTWTYGGVTVTANKNVIPADAQLVLGMLGTSSDANVYAAFEALVAKNDNIASKQMAVYTAKSEDGSVTPNGKFKITLAIPDGYTAANVVVMGEDGTVYEGVLSDDGKSITIETDKLGNYAVIDKEMSNDDGSEVAAASTTSGKTGDTSNVVLPIVIIAVAGAAVAVVYKKRKVGQN